MHGNHGYITTYIWQPWLYNHMYMVTMAIRAMTNSRSFGYESNFNEIRICFQNFNIHSRHGTLLQCDT